MGLWQKLFGGGRPAEPASQFQETDPSTGDAGSANAPRRELVKVVLREVMRKHSVPSDWIECRILSVTTRQGKPGMHVHFVVKKGEEQLLSYVHAFQDGFWRELERYEKTPRDWLFSLAWQLEGTAKGALANMPSFAGWDEEPEPDKGPETQPDAQDTLPPESHEAELQSDLAQLYAIRDAELSRPAELTDLPAPGSRPR